MPDKPTPEPSPEPPRDPHPASLVGGEPDNSLLDLISPRDVTKLPPEKTPRQLGEPAKPEVESVVGDLGMPPLNPKHEPKVDFGPIDDDDGMPSWQVQRDEILLRWGLEDPKLQMVALAVVLLAIALVAMLLFNLTRQTSGVSTAPTAAPTAATRPSVAPTTAPTAAPIPAVSDQTTATGSFLNGAGGCPGSPTSFSDNFTFTILGAILTIKQPSTGDNSSGPINPDGSFHTTSTSEDYAGQMAGTSVRSTYKYVYSGCTMTYQANFTLAKTLQLPVAAPVPTAAPTKAPTPTAVPTSATKLATKAPANGGGIPWWVVATVGILLVAGVSVLLRKGLVTTTLTPPAHDCDKEKQALAAAEAEVAKAAERYRALEAARAASTAADGKAKSAADAWDKVRKSSGAEPSKQSGIGPDGKTITRTGWNYKAGISERDKAAAEAARGKAEAAAAEAKSAKDAFDKAGGEPGYLAAKASFEQAASAAAAAREALAKCGGHPSGTDSGTDTSTTVPVPATIAKKAPDPCEDKAETQTVVVQGVIHENQLYRAEITGSTYFSGSDSVKDLVKKFGEVKDVIDIGIKVTGVAEPIGFLVDAGLDAARKAHRLPPAQPGYRDMMTDALPKALDGLADKLKNREIVGSYTIAWPRFKYVYKGTVTCTCKGGKYVVTDRKFDVDAATEGFMTIVTKDVHHGDTVFTQEELEREVGKVLNPAIIENNASQKKLYDEQAVMDKAGC